ncbi:sigma-70 family RNA polymerase sigma factor [Pararhizobium sp. DWP3-4]|uniref:sigma-70 family RNA polymerase sigma factor n=1 Tax=Pararhizobium sp. DWP3-4 TaxID=2804565 RepID=UPI003CE98F1E
MPTQRTSGFTDAELLDTLPALRAFARRFHKSPSDVEDLVQETLTKAIAHSSSYQHGTQLRSWLFTIMRNTFCTKFKVAKREQVGQVEDYAGRASSLPTQDWAIMGRELERAITNLPDSHRFVVDLVLVQGLSYEVAAQRCDVPVGTIKSRISRARIQLSKVLYPLGP